MRTREVSTGSQSKVVKPRSFMRRVLAIVLASSMMLIGLGMPAGATTPSPPIATLTNGSFERQITNGGVEGPMIWTNADYPGYVMGTVPAGVGHGGTTSANWGWIHAHQDNIPGWSTTEADHVIEIWHTNGNPTSTPAAEGSYFAEINANNTGTLYQALATTSGTLYRWSVEHRGRTGTDVANVLVGPFTAATSAAIDATPIAKVMSDGATAWGSYSGYYTATSAATTFALDAVSQNGGSTATARSMGNYVDNATWVPIASPATQTIVSGDPTTPVDPYMASNLASGYTETPDYTGIDVTKPGSYPVPVDIKDGTGTVIGQVMSTLIVEPKLTVKFQDASGNPIGTPATSVRGLGASYDTTYTVGGTVTIGGVLYNIKSQTGDPITGTMDDNKIVTYVLEPAAADVVTNFVDTNGDPIIDPTSVPSTSGASYTTTAPKQITNPATGKKWLLVGISPNTIDPASGTIKGAGADVTYVYQAANTVTVTLLGPDGKPMPAQPPVVWQPSGSPYSVKNPGTVVINGVTYKYVLQPGSDAESGTLNGDKALVYKLVPVTTPVAPILSLPLTGDTLGLAVPILMLFIAAVMALTALQRRREFD